MKAHSQAESAMVALLNKVDDGLGDSIRMAERLIEGGRIYPGDEKAGVDEMVLGYDIRPDCQLDEDGVPEDGQSAFDQIIVRLEVRQRGAAEGDEVVIHLPRDWRQPLRTEEDESLEEWFGRVGDVVGVNLTAS